MVLRQRLKKVATLKTVKELDAFPKVDEACRQTSPIGGTLSIVSYILMGWLMISETSYYLHSKIVYKFLPDTDFDQKVKIYIDLTVAMPCSSECGHKVFYKKYFNAPLLGMKLKYEKVKGISSLSEIVKTVGADILDSTQQNIMQFGELNVENTWFDLEPAQRIHFDHVKNVNAHLRQDYHQVHEYLWRSTSPSFVNEYIPRKVLPNKRFDACRIYGGLILNKVAGNLHLSAGKSLQLPHGHIHIAPFMSDQEYNFSHRINHFSFGDYSPGIVHPLEGEEKIASDAMMSYQYFIEVVPTEVKTFLSKQLTYQYSVKDHQRWINHHSGSHGIPGVYFKYDMSALKVVVVQERDSLIQFAVRLCATIGGIHVTSGLISSLVQFLIEFFNCKYLRKNDLLLTNDNEKTTLT